MSLRVALYAEGAGETGGTETLLPAPGNSLEENHLGPAHMLLRRAISMRRGLSEDAVSFQSPLRTRRARVARGSDLIVRRTLRELLSWPDPSRRPDLAIVLVDADGDSTRKRKLEGFLEGLPSATITVIAVAVQEFESWFVADHVTAGQPTPPAVEEMKCGEAKELLATWFRGSDASNARRDFARNCDLERIAKAAPSFARLLSDLDG